MTGPYVRFDLERVLKGSCSQNKQTKGEKPLAMPRSLIVQIGSRNCIGFGSGVLGGFAGFWGVLGGFAGFCFCFCFLGSGLWAGFAGFCFCFCFLGSGRWAPGLWFALGSADWVVLIEVYCFSPGAGLRNCIGFGSGVLPGFGGFCRVLGGFAFAFAI